MIYAAGSAPSVYGRSRVRFSGLDSRKNMNYRGFIGEKLFSRSLELSYTEGPESTCHISPWDTRDGEVGISEAKVFDRLEFGEVECNHKTAQSWTFFEGAEAKKNSDLRNLISYSSTRVHRILLSH